MTDNERNRPPCPCYYLHHKPGDVAGEPERVWFANPWQDHPDRPEKAAVEVRIDTSAVQTRAALLVRLRELVDAVERGF